MQMTRRAYTRYRGCSDNAVRYQIARGVIQVDPATGLINVEDADRNWLLLRERGPHGWRTVWPETQSPLDPELEAEIATALAANLGEGC